MSDFDTDYDTARKALNDLYHYTSDLLESGAARRLAPGRSEMWKNGLDALAHIQAEHEQLREALEAIRALPSDHDLAYSAAARAMHHIALAALGERP